MTLNQRRRSILPPYSSHPEEMVDKIDLSRYEVDGDYYLSSTVFRVSFPSDFLLRQYATLLQVENRVFKIPWEFLTDVSSLFAALYNLPQPNTNHVLEEGSSPDCPIRLEGILASDFKALLKILIPKYAS